ncbi:MAG: ribonuclease HI family protein [Elusimicrobiota bacterium]
MNLHIFIDGASRGNPGPAATGVVIRDEKGKTLQEFGRAIGTETNNVAEYTALLDALEVARKLSAAKVLVHSDSQLLVRQMNGQYRIKNSRLAGFLTRIRKLAGGFEDFTIVHVRRELNKRADKLANLALDAVKTKAAPGSGPAQAELFS